MYRSSPWSTVEKIASSRARWFGPELTDDVSNERNVIACPDAGEDEDDHNRHVIKFHFSTLLNSQRKKAGALPRHAPLSAMFQLSCLTDFERPHPLNRYSATRTCKLNRYSGSIQRGFSSLRRFRCSPKGISSSPVSPDALSALTWKVDWQIPQHTVYAALGRPARRPHPMHVQMRSLSSECLDRVMLPAFPRATRRGHLPSNADIDIFRAWPGGGRRLRRCSLQSILDRPVRSCRKAASLNTAM